MSENRTVRVFVSSPSDVRPERLIAERVVKRLAREFSYHFPVEAVLWEREPLLATHHFQDLIVPPHETDIVVTVLWSRLGVSLPEAKYLGAISKSPVTGTEWEFEDAVASYQQRGLPELLLYRKRAKITVELGDRTILEEQQHQSELVEEFMRRWFRSLDGKSFVAASREFADATEFESLLEEHLRALLSKRLTKPGDVETPATITWHRGSPYRGLEPFEIEHASIFFGRMRARNEIREVLTRQIERGCGFVLVTGASGSGKSSLVKAGVLPDLLLPGMVGRVALCRYAVTRPGATTAETSKGVLAALAQAFFVETALPEVGQAPLEYTPDRLCQLFDEAPTQSAQPIRQGLSAAGQKAGLTERGEARLVLVVDQLEELFTAGITQEMRERYIAALDALARSGLVWIIATMRSDFFDRIPTLPSLVALSAGEGTYLLAPPDAADIGQIIRLPAREAGLRFEIDERAGHSLDEVIREAAAKDPASLPLLEYLLDQLWHQRSADGMLTFGSYEALKGLEGAIGERAEQVLRDLPDTVREAFPSVLRALVTVGQAEGASPTARLVLLSTFAEGSTQRLLVEALIHPQARILVAYGDGSAARVRVAHEALLTHWERARLQITADRLDLRTRARIEEDEARWREAQIQDRAGLLLPPGRRLAEGEELLARRRAELDPALVTFIEASMRAAREADRRRTRARRFVTAALAGLLLLAAAAAAVGWKKQQEAQAANETVGVVQRLGRQTSDIGTKPQQSLLLSVQAAYLSKDGQEGTLTAIDGLRHQLRTTGGRPLHGHETAIRTAAFSPDQRWLATGSEDGAIRLWDLSPVDPISRVLALDGHKGPVHGLAFSADGRWLVSGAADGTVRLWRLTAEGAKPNRIFDEGRYGAIQSLALSPNGDWLVFGTQGGNVCIWKMSVDGPQEEPCEEWKDDVPVMQVLFSPRGRWLATSCTGACNGDNAPVRLWDLSADFPRQDPRRLSHATALNEASLLAIAFNADETRLAVAYGYVAEVWDLTQENPPQHVLGRYNSSGGWISTLGLSLSPDNHWLAIGSGSGSFVLLWDLTGSREEPITLKGHGAAVNSVVFSDDGRWLATGSADATARLWDLADPTLPSVLLRGQDLPVTKVVFSPGSAPRYLVTTGDGPDARLWNVPDPLVDPVVMRWQVKPTIIGMAVSSDGNWIATSSLDDSKLVLWSTKDPGQPQRELPIPSPSHALRSARMGGGLRPRARIRG